MPRALTGPPPIYDPHAGAVSAVSARARHEPAEGRRIQLAVLLPPGDYQDSVGADCHFQRG